MPIVNISLIEGRDPAAISACVKAVARSIHEALGVPLHTIRVIATTVPAAYWAVGAHTKDEADVASVIEVEEEPVEAQ
jgi:4-oxalocrotonate tautomerase